MKRMIRLIFNDGTQPIDLELSKATEISTSLQTINLEKLKDGTWRLIYSKDLIDDFSKLQSMEIVRED